MATEVLMPALSPTMTEGNLAKWLKKEGDPVAAGDVIAEIETDKATMEVEAVDEGLLGKIVVPAGSSGVKVNQLIAVLIEDGEGQEEIESIMSNYNDTFVAVKSESINEAKNSQQNSKPVQSSAAQEERASQAQVGSAVTATGRIMASPLARRIATDNNVDLANVVGSGPKGRVVKHDVLSILNSSGVAGGNAASQAGRVSDVYAYNDNSSRIQDVSVPLSIMRKVIAERLSESKQNIPHFYLSVDCDMDAILEMRNELNAEAREVDGKPEYKISVNDMIIKASAMALREVPAVNASWAGDSITQYGNIDISVAVSIEDGLITPIVFNADRKGLVAISADVKSLAARARRGGLKPQEFQGGSFCVSNLGMYGIDEFKAIVNPPQSCILAAGAVRKEPVVNERGEVVVAHRMRISLSCDHRVVDGAVGAEFISALRKFLQKPHLMLR